MSLTPKNWAEFQHYRDRAPAWIKLHRTLLDNVDYFRLSAEAGKALPLVWLLASEKDGIVPEVGELAFRLRIADELAAKILAELVERKFLVDAEHAETAERGATPAQQIAKQNGFGSRHISDVVKREVWQRDGGACCACGARENIEFDHKTPVSRGGASDVGNIQLLCRPCNRRKRTRVAAQAEHGVPPELDSRSLEKEGEERGEKEISRSISDRPARVPSRFDEFWQAYPRRDGPNPRKPAETRFNALVKTGLDPQMLIDEVRKFAAAETSRGNVGTRFIPQAATWLNQQRWSDHAAVAMLQQLGPVVEFTIEDAVKQWAKIGRWPRGMGPAPGEDGCGASAALLAMYGLLPDGRKAPPSDPVAA